jgi:hypothetical protein
VDFSFSKGNRKKKVLGISLAALFSKAPINLELGSWTAFA